MRDCSLVFRRWRLEADEGGGLFSETIKGLGLGWGMGRSKKGAL